VNPPVIPPEAVNCCVAPRGMVTLDGEMVREVTAAKVRDVVPVIPPKEALIVVDPAAEAAAVASPLPLIAAIPVSEELHDTNDVRSCVAPFWSEPRAKYWAVVPPAMTASAGESVIDSGTEDVSTVEPMMF
jgi:hypothetical protein